MPELNFKITGDDTELKKTLANIAKVAKENGDRISKEVMQATDVESKSREKATKVTREQKNATDEVVKAIEAEADAQNKVADAVRRKNAAFENGNQIRPVQMSDSQAEIDAANRSNKGTIPSGTVVGASAEWNRLSNEAASYGNAAKEAYNKAAAGANQTAKSNEDIRKAIRSLKIELQSYQNVSESTQDSKRLAEYNLKIQQTKDEIARLRNVGKAGFDEMGNKMSFAAGKMEILNNKLRMFQDGLNKAKAPQSFINLNRKIQETEVEIGRLKNAGRTGFDEFGNAIKKSSGAIGGLWSGLKQAAAILPGFGVAGLIAFASEPIIEYVKNLEIFKKTAKSIASDTAIDSSEYKSAVSGVNSLKVAIDDYHKGLLTGKQLLKEYNEGIGRTAGELENVTQVESFYNSKADAFVQAMYLRAQAQAALITATDALAEAQKRAANDTTMIDYGKAIFSRVWSGNFAGLGNIISDGAKFKNSAVDDLNKKGKDALNLFKDLQTASDKYNKDNNFNFNQGSGGSKGINSIISQQESLQKRIADLRAEYTRKALSSDEEELQSVRDKFKKIMDEAAKFNTNPKNRLHLVDTAGLTDLRDKAIRDLEYKQETERTKINLEKQKALYADYEDYKAKLGRDAADKRFGSEINSYVSYLDVLKAKQKEITDVAPEKRTGVQADYLKWLDKQVSAEVETEKKRYDNLVKEFISYSDQRKALTEKYKADIEKLEAKGDDTTARTTAYNDQINALDDANVQKLDAYKELFKGIDRLSDESAKRVIANAQSMLDGLVLKGAISKELAEQIKKMIADTDKALKDRMPERLINLANEIDRVADAVSEVDENFAKMLHTVGSVVGQVGNIKKGLSDLKLAQGNKDALGQLGAGLGIFGAGISIFSSITKLFDRSAQREAQAAHSRDLQNKQTEALNKALERQIGLIDEAYGLDRIERYNKAILQSAENEKKYQDQLKGRFQFTGDKTVDDLIAKFNNGEKLTDIGSMTIKKLAEAGKLTGVSGDIEGLQRLLDEGKLDAQTATIVENLIRANESAKELANNLKAESVGTSLESIADTFIEKLRDGSQDFGNSFEDIVRTSLINGFKGDVIKKQLQAFYNDFATATSDGKLTDEEIDILRKAYLAASEKAKADFEALGKATGIDLKDKEGTGSALSKSISSITSDQANALEGITRGQYEQLKLIVALQGTNNTITLKMVDISMQHLRLAEITAQNTGNTVTRLDTAIGVLQAISKNTGNNKGVDLRDFGAGGRV